MVLCVFLALSGCMRQDYHFIGNMMDGDMTAARQNALVQEQAAPAIPQRLAAMPGADPAPGGRG